MLWCASLLGQLRKNRTFYLGSILRKWIHKQNFLPQTFVPWVAPDGGKKCVRPQQGVGKPVEVVGLPPHPCEWCVCACVCMCVCMCVCVCVCVWCVCVNVVCVSVVCMCVCVVWGSDDSFQMAEFSSFILLRGSLMLFLLLPRPVLLSSPPVLQQESWGGEHRSRVTVRGRGLIQVTRVMKQRVSHCHPSWFLVRDS